MASTEVRQGGGRGLSRRACCMLALVLATAPALAAGDAKEEVLEAYARFLQAVASPSPAQELRPLVAPESPLQSALAGAGANQALSDLAGLLRQFQRQDVQVAIEAGRATVLATGVVPVTDPQLARYLRQASARHRVEFERKPEGWKVLDSDYRVRHSD